MAVTQCLICEGVKSKDEDSLELGPNSLDLNAVLDLLKVHHSEVLFPCQIANAKHHEIYELKLAYKFILIL